MVEFGRHECERTGRTKSVKESCKDDDSSGDTVWQWRIGIQQRESGAVCSPESLRTYPGAALHALHRRPVCLSRLLPARRVAAKLPMRGASPAHMYGKIFISC